MKITRTPNKTEKLKNLVTGRVFTFPNANSIYMLINEHDYFIDGEAVEPTEVVYVDLESGELYASDRETEVILINGSFVLDN